MSQKFESISSEVAQQARDEMQKLLSRSATDHAFRHKLVTDPRAALAEYGSPIPEGYNVVFIENKADATIVLPDPVDAEAELSDAELEAVAGGTSPGCLLIISFLVGTHV